MTVVRGSEGPVAEELRLCAVLKPRFRAKAELFRFCAVKTAQNRNCFAWELENPRTTVILLQRRRGELSNYIKPHGYLLRQETLFTCVIVRANGPFRLKVCEMASAPNDANGRQKSAGSPQAPGAFCFSPMCATSPQPHHIPKHKRALTSIASTPLIGFSHRISCPPRHQIRKVITQHDDR